MITNTYTDDGTLPSSYINSDDDLEEILPKKVKKQSSVKPEPAPKKRAPAKKPPPRQPTPEEILSDESTLESIALDLSEENDVTPDTSLESILSAPPKKRGPKPKSATVTPQTTSKPAKRASSGVKARGRKGGMVPETQVSVIEEESVEEVVDVLPRSLVPSSMNKRAVVEVLVKEMGLI
jgi:hypothetical protein